MSVLLPAPFSPSRASTSPGYSVKSIPRSACTPGNFLSIPRMLSSGTADLLTGAGGGWLLSMTGLAAFGQSRIVLRVFLIVKLGWNQDFRGNLLALEVLDDHLHSFLADTVRELDWITDNFSFENCLFANFLSVKADDFHLVSLAGRFESGASPQR